MNANVATAVACLVIRLTSNIPGSGGPFSEPRDPRSRSSVHTQSSKMRQQGPGRISQDYFGLHIHRAATTTKWPEIPFGSWRLWDSRTTWLALQPTPDTWRFQILDSIVALAERHHVKLLLTLGLTPQWASRRPTEPSPYQPGASAPPRDLALWREYVRTVALRYKG